MTPMPSVDRPGDHGKQPDARSGCRVLVAPDKFKGSLSAAEAARCIAEGIRIADPEAQISLMPIADGGEGTVEAFVGAGADVHTDQVHGPTSGPTNRLIGGPGRSAGSRSDSLSEPDSLSEHGHVAHPRAGQASMVDARWATLGDTAVIELAEASGLHRVTSTAEYGDTSQHIAAPEHALSASTRGVGELIRIALDHGYRSLLIGIGGSASTDGGFGAITELGARVLDADGAVIEHVRDLDGATPRQIDTTGLDSRLRETRIVIANDVTAPLTGEHGAAQVYGPQKGADANAVATLERRLTIWADLLRRETGQDVAAVPGAGAAGGFSAPFLALQLAQVRSGAVQIGELLGLHDALQSADVVVVGEGSLDEQSLQGKGPVDLAQRASAAGATVVALAGRSTLDDEQRAQAGIHRIETLVERADSRQQAIDQAGSLLRRAAEQVFNELTCECSRRSR